MSDTAHLALPEFIVPNGRGKLGEISQPGCGAIRATSACSVSDHLFMHEPLQKAVTRVLSPLVRLLLRHGVSHAEFANWAKQAYVDEAASRFGINGKPPSVSRIAIVTGINRKEVKRIRDLPADVNTGVAKHNRAVRVVTGWLQDPDFTTARGRPRQLVYGDAGESFNRLVRRHGGDVPARAMLDELVRVGTVALEEGRVTLLQQGYVPHESESALLDLFAISATDLLTTLDHNLAGKGDRRLQLSVAYDNVTSTGADHFRRISAERSRALLLELDGELRQHDLDVATLAGDADGKSRNVAQLREDDALNAADGQGNGGRRIGLGVYLIEDIDEDEDTDGS